MQDNNQTVTGSGKAPSVNHAEALAEALREIGHDFAEIRLWLKDQDVKSEAKLASVATLINHANKKAIAARAAWEGASK